MAKPTLTSAEMQPPVELMERRYIYNGEFQHTGLDGTPLRNRPLKRRKRSPFNIIFMLFMVSVIIVFYVWNKINVNRLAVEVSDLQTQYQKIMNGNEVLMAEINKKSSLERIEKISVSQLNLTYAKEQPVWFDVDGEHIGQLR